MTLQKIAAALACTAPVAFIINGCGGSPTPSPPGPPSPPVQPTPSPTPPPATDCRDDQAQCTSCINKECQGCNPGYVIDKSVTGSRCKAACLGKAPILPSKPSTPLDFNGLPWPSATEPVKCIDAYGAHFFGIGDWGGMGQSGDTWLNPDQCAARGDAGCPHPVDQKAQLAVAKVMKKQAAVVKPDYILNVGDNFYPGGITTPCGTQGTTPSDTSHQWADQFDGVYSGPELKGIPWYSVLGNHDYGGIMYGAGWDAQIFTTWERSDWVMPAQYWSTTIYYADFAVEVFFLDSNVADNGMSGGHGICQGNQQCWTMTSPQSCSTELRSIWSEGQKMLEAGLKKSTAEWHFVVTHFPATQYAQDCGSDDCNFFTEMHKTYGIDLFITGHAHHQKTGRGKQECDTQNPSECATPLKHEDGKIAWVVTGGGGGVTADLAPTPSGHDDHSYGFTDFTIDRTSLQIDMHSWGGPNSDKIIVATQNVTSHKLTKKQVQHEVEV